MHNYKYLEKHVDTFHVLEHVKLFVHNSLPIYSHSQLSLDQILITSNTTNKYTVETLI